jgi:mono/diheme cytochrome c family protein
MPPLQYRWRNKVVQNMNKRNDRSAVGIRRLTMAGVMIALLGPGPSRSRAQEPEVIAAGKHEFQRSCATCHGVDATGNGPSAAVLNVKPADLTQLSKNHGGVFLFWRVYEEIEGSKDVVIRGHGTREMPIWGERFRFEKSQSADHQTGVRGRILSLVYYLQSIQEK